MATKKTPSKKPATKLAAPVLHFDFFQPGFWSQHQVPILAYLAISFIFYGITIGYGYLQDDQLFIWDNSFVQQGFGGLANIFGHDSLLGFYKDPKLMLEGGRYRPLPLATFAIEVGLFGKDSAGYAHFFNVLYYGLTGILLYRVLLGLFPLKDGGKWISSVPFLAGLLFMLHPLHVEAVANIKSRDEIFALLGSLGALYAIMKYFDTEKDQWRWIAAGSFLLGMLSKENTTTFLAVIPLTLWMFSKLPFGRILAACGPMFIALLAFLLLRAIALDTPIEHPDEMVLNPFMGMKASEKVGTIFLSLGWYLKLLFVPHPLTIDYYPYHVPKVTWTDWRALLSLAGYLILGFWAVRKMSKIRNAADQTWTVPAYSILYFLLTISVVSNIFVRTSTFLNERYLFMPSVGFCLLVAWFAAEKLPALMRKSPEQSNIAGKLAYTQRAEAYIADLQKLDADFAAATKSFKHKSFVGFHSAYGYLAHRYGLTQAAAIQEVGTGGMNPAQIQKTIEIIKTNHVPVVFSETAFDAQRAAIVVQATGVKLGTLQPLETYDNLHDTYLKLMRENLAQLTTAMKD